MSATKRIVLTGAACVALSACGSLQTDEVIIASGAVPIQTVSVPEYSAEETSDGSAPTTAVPTTAVPTTAVPTTAVPTTAVPTTAVPIATASPSGDNETGDGDVAVAGIAQTQDDDDGDQAAQELPRTGTNEVMVLIAIGCAMIVGGRSLIDLMNSMARAIQRSRPAAPAPPR